VSHLPNDGPVELCTQVRGFPCDCTWPEQCDSQLQQLPPTRNLLKVQAAASGSGDDGAAASAETVSPPAEAGSQQRGGEAELAVSGQSRLVPGGSQSAVNGLHAGRGAPPGQLHIGRPGAGNSAAQRMAALRLEEGQGAEQPSAAKPKANGGSLAATVGCAGSASEAACQQMEDRFVNDVYNTIAPHFNSTRCGHGRFRFRMTSFVDYVRRLRNLVPCTVVVLY